MEAFTSPYEFTRAPHYSYSGLGTSSIDWAPLTLKAPTWSSKSFALRSQFSRQGDRRGPSHAAHLQNSKAQWCFTQIERCNSAPSLLAPRLLSTAEFAPRALCPSSGGAGDSGGGEQSGGCCGSSEGDTEARARLFEDGLNAVDQLLAAGKTKRGETTLRSREEEQRLLEQEEERRQHELDLRRARRRERDARDPHRKVALKLERHRRFAQDASTEVKPASGLLAGRLSQPRRRGVDADRIPMQFVDIANSSGGMEQVKLVDVASLRARCIKLPDGASGGRAAVDALLEERRLEERRRIVSSLPH